MKMACEVGTAAKQWRRLKGGKGSENDIQNQEVEVGSAMGKEREYIGAPMIVGTLVTVSVVAIFEEVSVVRE